MMQVLEIVNLSKLYGKKQILQGITFSLNEGQAIGILGPNGAGKTTLLKTICGLAKPSNGRIILHGLNSHHIATIFEDQRFLGQLSGRKNMKLFLNTIGEREASLEKKFEQFGLRESMDAKFRVYSSGMKKRMDLMSVFVGGKRLFLLDEPTNGLDIDGMIAFNEQVMSIKKMGKSFILASHHALEMEKICDLFLLIDKGTVVSQMSKQELLNGFDSLESVYSSLIQKSLSQNLRKL